MGYKKTDSRKWKLILLIIIIATIGTFIPPMLSIWIFKSSTPLVILSGSNFITLSSLVISAYFGSNILQKKFLADASTLSRNNDD